VRCLRCGCRPSRSRGPRRSRVAHAQCREAIQRAAGPRSALGGLLERDGSIAAMFSWRRPTNLGVKDGRLAPCKRTPNCVSSQADPADREHYIAPIAFHGSMQELRRAVESMARATVISGERNYLYAEFRTKLMRYVD